MVQEDLKQLDSASAAAINAVVMVGISYRIPGRRPNVDSQDKADNRTAYGLFAKQVLQSKETVLTYSEQLDRSWKVKDICLEACSP